MRAMPAVPCTSIPGHLERPELHGLALSPLGVPVHGWIDSAGRFNDPMRSSAIAARSSLAAAGPFQ
jgi:hypothetical protein